MVRVLRGEGRPGVRGKLISDPERGGRPDDAIELAAAALNLGVADPLAFLALSPADAAVAAAVLHRAAARREAALSVKDG